MGGEFSSLAGYPRNSIGRLTRAGIVDTNYNPGINSEISCILIQNDGKAIVGGYFTQVGTNSWDYLARLNPDGTLDASFAPKPNGPVTTMALRTDGKIAVGGAFTMVGGQNRSNLCLLNPDGTVDPSFNPGANATVNALAIQTDGNILVGGLFTQLGAQARSYAGRLAVPDPATHLLTFDGESIQWARGGASPEVSHATFEISNDQTNWVGIGNGARTATGWQVTGQLLSSNTTIRARGLIAPGQYYSSCWYIEDKLSLSPANPPGIISYDGAFGFGTNGFGFNVAGLVGQVVVVERSTDLAHWLPVATNTITSGPFHFWDSPASGQGAAFYRARLQ